MSVMQSVALVVLKLLLGMKVSIWFSKCRLLFRHQMSYARFSFYWL